MLRLNICSINFGIHINLKDTERRDRQDRPSISFDASMNGNDYIEFETGEIFGNGGHEHGDAVSIDCSVDLYASDEQKDAMMQYVEGRDHEEYSSYPSLGILIPLLPSELDFIVDNIQSGIFPITMDIDWHTNFYTVEDGEGKRTEPKNIIEYGWEPDGHHQIWNNAKEENRRIILSSASFTYSPLPVERNEEGYLVEPPQSKNVADIMRSDFASLRQRVEEYCKKLDKIVRYLLILVTMGLLILFFK
jgi:hypothetical protein